MDQTDNTNDNSSESSEASPIVAVEVNTEGDVKIKVADADNNTNILPSSDLSDLTKKIWIVTTAGLPWRTGTAVNPLLRGLELARVRPPDHVTLMIPWIPDRKARSALYGMELEKQESQLAWIDNYIKTRCSCPNGSKLRIRFYTGMLLESFGSIFPVEDICALIPKEEADVCILEEPEHLNWFRAQSWISHFPHVVGILHTNYADYVRQYASLITAPALNSLSGLVVKAYTHRLIKLSATLPDLDPSKEITSNVHGVREEFFDVESVEEDADDAKEDDDDDDDDKEAPVYFIGKLIWAKGFEHILELQEAYKKRTGGYFPIDIYGSGKDAKDIKLAMFGRRRNSGSSSDSSDQKAAAAVFESTESLRDQLCGDMETTPAQAVAEPLEILGNIGEKTITTSINTADAALKALESAISVKFDRKLPRSRFKWRRNPIPARFLGVLDHVEVCGPKIFLNMSTSEVLCTTTAEALAMGKFVILPHHPSNTFFFHFDNCLPYKSLEECATHLEFALSNAPKPLSPEHRHELSWAGATERLVKAAAITIPEAQARIDQGDADNDKKAARFHKEASKKSHYVREFMGQLMK